MSAALTNQSRPEIEGVMLIIDIDILGKLPQKLFLASRSKQWLLNGFTVDTLKYHSLYPSSARIGKNIRSGAFASRRFWQSSHHKLNSHNDLDKRHEIEGQA